ncbi:MAG TPA: PIN domain-containing protein [Dissulfurispiraceae bacterium]|nr:PIN domain-containing protein [Dissulfurispiraceae bacterium]
MKAVNGVLADTCLWIDFLKAAPQSSGHMAGLISANALCVCGAVLFELLQGVRSDTEKKRILSAIGGLSYYEMTQLAWHYAADLSAGLKKSGTTVPLSDILVAALAHQYDLMIFTHDQHFDHIPGVRLYRP